MINTELSNIAENLIASNVYCSQSALVSKCLESGMFSYDDITNLYDMDDEEHEGKDILEWVRVSDRLADQLQKHGEPVLSNEYGIWWGRTTYGQKYSMDSVIEDIAKTISER